MPERKFDDFDEYASAYRKTHTENIRLSGADSFYFAEMKVRLLRDFEKNVTLKILDVGCGDGATETYFQKYFSRWEVTGIDVSEKSISEAKSKYLSNVVFKTYDGIHIESNEEEFDIVFMAGVLHHIDFDLHAPLLAEIKRVLKKNGRFYLFEHNPLNPLTRYLVNTCVFDKHARMLRSRYAVKLLQTNKFRIRKKQFIIFFPRKRIFAPLLFLEKYLRWLPLGGQYFISAVK
jgi:SAM-dependent methyltransferase